MKKEMEPRYTLESCWPYKKTKTFTGKTLISRAELDSMLLYKKRGYKELVKFIKKNSDIIYCEYLDIIKRYE